VGFQVFILITVTQPQKFNKPPLTLDQHINLLISRGLIINDQTLVKDYLQFIGYYRLSAYFIPFQTVDNKSEPHQFKPNTTFENVLDLYIFDRKLRLLFLDAIERIEVAIKAIISNTITLKYNNAYWFLNEKLFNKYFQHQKFLAEIQKEINQAKKSELFIKNYYQKYNNPNYPPSWMLMELLSLGTVSTIYKYLNLELKKEIAQVLSIPYIILESWLHSLSYTRNICAHHSRLWNRTFTIKPKIIKKFKQNIPNNDKLLAQILIVIYLLKKITNQSHWLDNFKALTQEYPQIKLSSMGIPQNWDFLSM